MGHSLFSGVIGALSLLVAGASIAEEVHADQVEDLLAQCQAERQARIEPLRQEAIQSCVSDGRGELDYCERFYRDYGERTAGGTPAMFWDLPICIKADAAERYFKMNPGSKRFNYQ